VRQCCSSVCVSRQAHDIVALRRTPLHRPTPPDVLSAFLPDCDRAALEACEVDAPTTRSPCACTRLRPAHLAVCATRPGASIVTTSDAGHLPWTQYRVRFSCACAHGAAATAPAAPHLHERLPTMAAPGRPPAVTCAGPAPGGASASRWGESRGTPRPRVGPAGQPAHAPAPPPQCSQSETPHASVLGSTEFIPIKSLAATGSDAPGKYAGTAACHHQVTDALLPQAQPVLHDATSA